MRSKEDKMTILIFLSVIFVIASMTVVSFSIVDCSYLFILVVYFIRYLSLKKEQ